MFKLSLLTAFIAVILMVGSSLAQMQSPQAPFPQQQPGPMGEMRPQPPQQMAPMGRPQVPQQYQQQQSLQYAFKPELTNPEYGQCLQLEKQWKALYQRYYQEYERIRMYGAQSGDYVGYLQNLRQQMDAAWNNFSSRCVYFPKKKQ